MSLRSLGFPEAVNADTRKANEAFAATLGDGSDGGEDPSSDGASRREHRGTEDNAADGSDTGRGDPHRKVKPRA